MTREVPRSPGSTSHRRFLRSWTDRMIPNIAVQLRLRPKPRANDLAFWTRINPITRRSRMRARRTYKTIRAMSDAGSGTSMKPKAATVSSVSETIAAHITNIRAFIAMSCAAVNPIARRLSHLYQLYIGTPGGKNPWADDTSDSTQPMVSSVMVRKYHNLLETWMVDAATLRPCCIEFFGPVITATLAKYETAHPFSAPPAEDMGNHQRPAPSLESAT